MIEKKNTKEIYNKSGKSVTVKTVLGTRIIRHGGIGMFLWLTTQIQTQMIIY